MVNLSTDFDAGVKITEETLLEEKSEALWNRAKARGTEVLEDTMDLIRRYPGRAIAAAGLAGVAAGAIVLSQFYSEPVTFSDRMGDFSLEKWKKVRQGIVETLTVSRDVLDTLLRKMN